MTVRGIILTNKAFGRPIFVALAIFEDKVIMDESVAHTSILSDIAGKHTTINVTEDIATILAKLKQENEQYKKENFLL